MDYIDLFHEHLDVCLQCANEPFNLCEIGAELAKKAVS